MDSAKAQKIPLVVAIVCQREFMPEYEASVMAEVRALLVGLMDRYPSTPVIALTTLAWKSDLLCAAAALKAGCALYAALPFEAGVIKEGMAEEDRETFDALYAKCMKAFTVPLYEKQPAAENNEDIPEAYYFRQAAIYMARHSSLTLVCHDGIKRMGDADAFAYDAMTLAREQPFSKMTGMGVKENSGIVIELITPREHGPRITLPLPVKLKVHAGGLDALEFIDGFNADVVRQSRFIAKRMPDEMALVMNAKRAGELKDGEMALLKIAAQADILAQRVVETRFLAIMCVCLACLIAMLVFMGIAANNTGAVIGEAAALVTIAALVFHMSGVRRYHKKHLRYILLSRFARVQFYLEIANMRDYHFPFDARRRDGAADFAAKTAAVFRKSDWSEAFMGAMSIIRKKWLGAFFQDSYGALLEEEALALAKKQVGIVLLIALGFALLSCLLAALADIRIPPVLLNVFLAASGAFFLWHAYRVGVLGVENWKGTHARLCRIMKLAKKRMDAANGNRDRKEQYYVLLLTANAFIEESLEWYFYHRGTRPRTKKRAAGDLL